MSFLLVAAMHKKGHGKWKLEQAVTKWSKPKFSSEIKMNKKGKILQEVIS